MVDLQLNDLGEVFIGSRKDVAAVDGREEFEQRLYVFLEEEMATLPGEMDRDSVPELIRVKAGRVAKRMGQLSNLANVEARWSEEETKTIEVTLLYDTNESTTFEVS